VKPALAYELRQCILVVGKRRAEFGDSGSSE
jgi:hypothetical protein